MSAIARIAEQAYRIGNCEAIRYDRARTDLFPDGYISHLYDLCKQSGRRDPSSFLNSIFGGNPIAHFDAVVPFLATRHLIILGVWEGEKFREAGIAFPVLFCGSPQTEMAAFCGFGFFREFWGSEEINTLSTLGLAMLYQEFKLIAIHGTRFPENTLARQFMNRFGFRDLCELPHYQLQEGKLVPAVISTLARDDFEKVAEKFLAGEQSAEPQPAAPVPAETHPIDIEIRQIVSAARNVAWLPKGTQYAPTMPDGVSVTIIDEGVEDDGFYFYAAGRVEATDIWIAVANGKKAELLAVKEPALAPKPAKMVTIQAFRNGQFVGSAAVPATADAIGSVTALFPGAELRVKKEAPPEERKASGNGGKSRASKMSKEQRSESARRAARARWKQNP